MADYTIETRVSDILKDLYDKITGIESVYLIDLSNIELVAAYPSGEGRSKEFISEISGNNIHQFETQAADAGEQMILTEMEVLTERYRIYTNRVTKDYLLCIVGDIVKFRSGFAKRLCDGPVREELITTLTRYGIPVSRL